MMMTIKYDRREVERTSKQETHQEMR